MFKAVLFDVDGTLVDSNAQHARAWAEAFREFGHDVPEADIRPQIGKGGDQLMPVFLSAEELDDHGEALERRRGEIFRERHLPGVQPLPGARDLLKRADAAGLRVALASSAKGEELAAMKRLLDIEDHDVDATTSADDADASKPAPDIFIAALARLPGATADEAVVIGDTPYDAQAARKAGMACLGVLSGGFGEEELKAAGCLAVYRDVLHLLEDWAISPLGAEAMPD